MRLLEVRKIWDNAPHNAFTDLIRFNEKWICVFREGESHVSFDGAIRVLESEDGDAWQSAALIATADRDLRDPKLSLRPDGRLELVAVQARPDNGGRRHQTAVWLSEDGRTWDAGHEIGDPDYWLWRITWRGEEAYSVGYHCGNDHSVRLYRSFDGIAFEPLVDRLYDEGFPNESSVVFSDETAYCLLRRDGTPNSGLIGQAEPPYVDWHWSDLGARIGGPQMMLMPDRSLLAAVRLYDDKDIRTSLCTVQPRSGGLTEALRLPSGGDTSYAGLALADGDVWVSYYSSHEGQTSVYLAKVEV